MSRSAVPESPAVPPDLLADLERRLARVERAVGVPTAASQPRRPVSEPALAPRSAREVAPATSSAAEDAAEARATASARDARPSAGPDPRTGELRPERPSAGRDPRDGLSWGPRPVAAPPLVPTTGRPPARATIDEALVGGRLLAWAGGAALLFALGTLFWLGVRDGWLSESLRCLIGAVAASGLLAAGLRNARNGSAREASWAMAGTGLAGLYATGAVATATYDLLPGLLGLPALAALGVAAARLALRWDAPPLAGVGLLGALGAPVIAPVDGLVLPVVVVAMASTGVLLRHRPWTWLAAAASVLALPQVVWHVGTLLDDLQYRDDAALATIAAPGIAVLAALAAGLAMVAGWEIRAPRYRERWSMPLLLVAHAAVAAALAGAYALVDEPAAAVVTLVAAAGLLGGSALLVRRRAGAASHVELVLLAAAVLVVDLGFAIAASGLLQLVGWAVCALAFALLARHAARTSLPLTIGGLGLHAGLTLIETVGASGDGDGGFLVACAVLAGVCAVSGRVVAPRSEDARRLLDLTALGVVLWWTAATLPADRLALALAGEAGALLLLDRRSRDLVARGAGLTFLAIGAAIALLHGDAAAVRAAWDVVPEGEPWTVVLPLLAVAGAASVGVATLRGAMATSARSFGGDREVLLDGSEAAGVPFGGREAAGVPFGRSEAAGVPRDGGEAAGVPRDGGEAAGVPRDGGEAAGVPASRSVRGALAALAGATALLAASVLAGHLTVAAGGGADAVAVVRDVLWASTGLALLAAGLLRTEAPVRLVGLSLLAGVGGKIALLDLADVDTAGRVVAWAVLGALLLVGAGLYARLTPRVPEGSDASAGREADRARDEAPGTRDEAPGVRDGAPGACDEPANAEARS